MDPIELQVKQDLVNQYQHCEICNQPATVEDWTLFEKDGDIWKLRFECSKCHLILPGEAIVQNQNHLPWEEALVEQLMLRAKVCKHCGTPMFGNGFVIFVREDDSVLITYHCPNQACSEVSGYTTETLPDQPDLIPLTTTNYPPPSC